MGVPRKNFVVSAILDVLDANVPFIPLETPYEWLSRKQGISRRQYQDSLRNLRRSGVLLIVQQKDGKFLKLTKKGALKQLLIKARHVHSEVWDGKWRLIIFDIPEEFHSERDRFRKLLRVHNFYKLQGSVFISPYSLSRESLEFLHESGLDDYVRIMKVEELDREDKILKHFGLKR